MFYVVISQFATSTTDVCFEGVLGAGAGHVANWRQILGLGDVLQLGSQFKVDEKDYVVRLYV